MIDLSSLDKEFGNKSEPDWLEIVYYMFWEKGISLEEFNRLPIPYILNIVKTHAYIKEREEKAQKKANRGK